MVRSVSATTLSSYANIRQILCSYPLLQISMSVWRPLRARQGTNKSHLGHRGWSRLPSSIISSVYHTRPGKKWIRRLVRIVSLPQYPNYNLLYYNTLTQLYQTSVLWCHQTKNKTPIKHHSSMIKVSISHHFVNFKLKVYKWKFTFHFDCHIIIQE